MCVYIYTHTFIYIACPHTHTHTHTYIYIYNSIFTTKIATQGFTPSSDSQAIKGN